MMPVRAGIGVHSLRMQGLKAFHTEVREGKAWTTEDTETIAAFLRDLREPISVASA